MDIIRILWKCLHFLDIIRILWISWIYPHFVGIICIGHITSYLARNVCPIFHIYSSSVSTWCITYFTVCNLIYFYVTSSSCLVRVVSEYKLNPNHIHIYVPYVLGVAILKTNSWFFKEVIRLDVYSIVIFTLYYYPSPPTWKVVDNIISSFL